ncbi:MAG: class A beta-lactamase-related serine hydrolase [Calditrichaeota bacterium]|nr:MAG: class A beta-lactamase-related serine hydrolase [Calditrichota bacterium]
MQSHAYRYLLIFLLILYVPVIVFGQKYTGPNVEKATVLAEEFMQESKAAGLAISVGKNGKIIWSAGFGFADLEQNVPILPARTKFRIGSVAKPITAAGLALLYEQGRIDLDAPVQKYVPTFPEKRWPITTRSVAGHLAGIRHYRGEEFLSVKHYETVLEGLAIFAKDTLLFMPGTRYSYSSYGWNLVSAIVEGAAGEPFLEFMNKKVFRPLGMFNTIADHLDSIIVGRSRYYEFQDSVLVNGPPVDNSYKWAGGGFISTSEDVVRFGFAHLNEKFLKKKTIDEFWASQKTNAGKETNYGIGWSSGIDNSGRKWVGHSGGSVGGSTFFRMYPKESVVVVLISNMSGLRYNELPSQIAEIFLKTGK